MNRYINEIIKILQTTDDEFINELNQQIYQLFLKHYGYIKNKKILFFNDEIYKNTNYAILNNLLESNNHLYCFINDKVVLNQKTNERINVKKQILPTFDYVITSCVIFDYSSKIVVSDKIMKRINQIQYKDLIALALNIQCFAIKNNDQNQLKANIITNNFLIDKNKHI